MAIFQKAERIPGGAPEDPADAVRKRVAEAIEEVRPFLQADGGDVELVEVSEGTVKVRLKGACGCCPMAMMTLKAGIEQRVRESVPEIKEVVAVQ